MIKREFRSSWPRRNYIGKEFSDYRKYKDHLAIDFQDRCGYTACGHLWFGGKRNFQIDHFKPIKHYPDLKTSYSNLVYSCSYVNRAKSDDMREYLDPCEVDYNLHFYRDEMGCIYPVPNSVIAKYMYRKLKLYLKRYSVIWMLEELDAKLTVLKGIIELTHDAEAKELFIAIGFKYIEYKKYLAATQ